MKRKHIYSWPLSIDHEWKMGSATVSSSRIMTSDERINSRTWLVTTVSLSQQSTDKIHWLTHVIASYVHISSLKSNAFDQMHANKHAASFWSPYMHAKSSSYLEFNLASLCRAWRKKRSPLLQCSNYYIFQYNLLICTIINWTWNFFSVVGSVLVLDCILYGHKLIGHQKLCFANLHKLCFHLSLLSDLGLLGHL